MKAKNGLADDVLEAMGITFFPGVDAEVTIKFKGRKQIRAWMDRVLTEGRRLQAIENANGRADDE